MVNLRTGLVFRVTGGLLGILHPFLAGKRAALNVEDGRTDLASTAVRTWRLRRWLKGVQVGRGKTSARAPHKLLHRIGVDSEGMRDL